MTVLKKTWAFILIALMVFAVLPSIALAADGTITADGTYLLADYGNTSAITINAGLTVTLAGDAATTYTGVQIFCGEGVKLTLSNVNISNNNASFFGFCPPLLHRQRQHVNALGHKQVNCRPSPTRRESGGRHGVDHQR